MSITKNPAPKKRPSKKSARGLTALELKRIRKLAAQKGWVTRRRNALKKKRSEAAKKGWVTRRAREIQGREPLTPEEIRDLEKALDQEIERGELEESEKRSIAALKGWETRRRKQRQEKRKAAAKKAAETRRRKKERERIEAEARSEAARRGWETRRRRQLETAVEKRTRQQRRELRRKQAAPKQIRFARFYDEVRLSVSPFTQGEILDMVNFLRSNGVTQIRFIREVPVTPKYPKGVASTNWYNIKNWTDNQLNYFIGAMMVPGIDFVRQIVIKERQISKMPKAFRDQVYAAEVLTRDDDIK